MCKLIDKSTGYVPVWRHVVSDNWEWAQDFKTTFLYIWLTAKANWEPKKWKGQTIAAGEYVTSYSHLAQETGMSKDEIRTAIKHLVETHYITHKNNKKYSVITVKNYSDLYLHPTQNHTQIPQSSHTDPTLTPTTKPLEPLKPLKERGDKPPRAPFKPPDENSVIEFFKACKSTEQEAKKFCAYYSSNGWMVGKNRMKDWKAAGRSWLMRAGQYMPPEKPPSKGGQSMADYNRMLDEELNAL